MKDDFYGEVAKQTAPPGGGATINVHTGQPAESGWAVAQAGHEHVEPRQTFSENSLKRYAGEHREALEQAGHMGLWNPSQKNAPGVYHDATKVNPNTYAGGVSSIAEGYKEGQQAIYHIDSGQELQMHPQSRRQRQGTRKAMGGLRAQRPKELGPETTVHDMPTADLGAALRNRRTVQG